MRKKFLPFALPSIEKEEINEVIDTLKSRWITTGPRVKKFEKEFVKFINAKYAVAVNSCTAALHLALAAIELKRGDEVLVPTMTFASTAEVVRYFDAKPVLVDIKSDTLLIDLGEIEKKITKKTKAIIPVHYAGQACDIDKILKIARKYKLKVIWDAAHALPTKYKGKLVGTFPDITCFSFYATKPITMGEGGIAVTGNKKWAEKMRILSLHGISKDAWKRYTATGSWYYEIIYPGFKYNLTDIAASLGLVQFKKCNLFLQKRKKIARIYNRTFNNLPEITILRVEKYGTHAWHLYAIQLNLDRLKIGRDKFIEELKKRKIGVSVHFIPLHLHPYYKQKYGYKPKDLPNAYHAYQRIISLPIYPKMTTQDIKDVIWAIKDIINKFKKC
jgi:perosamine synthetase